MDCPGVRVVWPETTMFTEREKGEIVAGILPEVLEIIRRDARDREVRRILSGRCVNASGQPIEVTFVE